MSISKVRSFFRSHQIEDRVLEFDVSSATVELAAEALGTEPKRIAKSMAFMTKSGPIIIVTAGDVKIDNGKYKKEFSEKAKMLTPGELIELIGHPMGGVCPFAIKDGVRVYLDGSLKRFETVFPACGSENSAIELTIEELEKYSNTEKWVDVCKMIEAL